MQPEYSVSYQSQLMQKSTGEYR